MSLFACRNKQILKEYQSAQKMLKPWTDKKWVDSEQILRVSQ